MAKKGPGFRGFLLVLLWACVEWTEYAGDQMGRSQRMWCTASGATVKSTTWYRVYQDGTGSPVWAPPGQDYSRYILKDNTKYHFPLSIFPNWRLGAATKQVAQMTSSNVSSIGTGAVKHWLESLRRDQSLWAAFLDACRTIGVMDKYGSIASSEMGQNQLRRLMQLLLTKYVHANLTALLRHTAILCAKDTADAQALREERKAAAAQAKKDAEKAAKEAKAQAARAAADAAQGDAAALRAAVAAAMAALPTADDANGQPAAQDAPPMDNLWPEANVHGWPPMVQWTTFGRRPTFTGGRLWPQPVHYPVDQALPPMPNVNGWPPMTQFNMPTETPWLGMAPLPTQPQPVHYPVDQALPPMRNVNEWPPMAPSIGEQPTQAQPMDQLLQLQLAGQQQQEQELQQAGAIDEQDVEGKRKRRKGTLSAAELPMGGRGTGMGRGRGRGGRRGSRRV